MSEPSPRPNLTELRAVCGKGDAEPFWISRFLIRPWSVYWTYLALRLGLAPSQVTVISAVLAVSAGFFALWPSRWTYAAAAGLTLSFFVLDHVDGEMARYYASIRESPVGTIDISGKYLDRLVHYLQAPSLFLGITLGIAIGEREPLWGALGIVCALGSGGFPRFTASYDLLVAAVRSDDGLDRDFMRRAAGFNTIYGQTLLGGRFFLLPRSMQGFLTLVRQYLGFPGNLFVLSGALLVDAILLPTRGVSVTKAVTVLYAFVLAANLVYATRKYFLLLKQVPK